MNRAHSLVCSSGWWARGVERELLPWGLADTDLGDDALEIGPGFGATTRVLTRRPGSLTVLEVFRVLRAGGVFAGTDSLGTGRAFKLLHVRDTLVPVAPEGLPSRLRQAGLIEPQVELGGRSFRFQARKPA
jgi:hypothetical protein